MAKNTKTKKISVTAFEKIMKNTVKPDTKVAWNGEEITIRKTLPLKDMLSFVNNVVKSSFAADTGEYIPEVTRFAINYYVLDMYANFTMPTSAERAYELVYNTDAVNIVMQHINFEQYSAIEAAIEYKIDNILRTREDVVMRQLTELSATLDSLQRYIEITIGDVNAEDVASMAKAIAGGVIDETKLVQAYIEQTKKKGGD